MQISGLQVYKILSSVLDTEANPKLIKHFVFRAVLASKGDVTQGQEIEVVDGLHILLL